MTPREMGLVFNQLVERRVLYTFTTPGRNRSQEEREAVSCLERHLDYHEELDAFLSTQGIRLMSFEAAALEIGSAGRVYVAVRDPLYEIPKHIGGSGLLREISDSRRQETAAEATLWSGLFFVVLLQLLYSDYGRPIEAISRFSEAEFEEAQFVQTTLFALERQRGATVNAEDPDTLRAHRVFTSATETQVETRARGFLRAMLRGDVIDIRVDDDKGVVYGQTLWSAVDVAENFKRYAGGLLPRPDADDVAALVAEETSVIKEQ